MAARTFEDSAGTVWEVFEVHRASEAPRGVSPGLEKGWLSFVSVHEKRRLAPFPATWEKSTDRELEQFCAGARIANPPRYPGIERRSVVRSGPASAAKRPTEVEAAPVVRSSSPMMPGSPAPDDAPGAEVRKVIRSFASDARAQQLPAIEALVRLKALLVTQFTGAGVAEPEAAAAADMRRVRRWFVESYYFERR